MTLKGSKRKAVKRFVSLGLLMFTWMLVSSSVYAQNVGTLQGVVTEYTNGDPIFGANIFIVELSRGAATDLEGRYIVERVPVGTYKVRVSFLGMKTRLMDVTINANETVTFDVALEEELVEGEVIEIRAQALGQAAAIKDQMNSNTIVNVVSAERISELPDQNAAESIGRLPGVSVQRNAGEASKIVVRGLSPKFNSITVNGVRLPGSDPNDRSVDLSLIPSDVLGGIEVYKALTPDKDGDAIGGTVNLLVRKAPAGFKGDLRLQTGYNDLENEYGQYKFSLNLSDRFFDDKLGVLLTGSVQKANRSSDLLDADYSYRQESESVEIDNLNLADIQEERDRYGASLALDYDLDATKFYLNSFWGRTDRDEVRRRKRYRVSNGRVEYDLRDRTINSQVYSNSLRAEHKLSWIVIDWQLTNSYSLRKQPYSVYSRFQELTAYQTGLIDNLGPEPIPQFAKNDLSRTYFLYSTYNPERGTDRNYTAEANFKVPFNFDSGIDGFVKFGGKIRDKKKVEDINQYQTDFNVVSEIGQANTDTYDLYNDEHIRIGNFINPDFEAKNFMNGRYEFGPGLNNNLLNNFYENYQDMYLLNRIFELGDYTAGEKINAAYLMAEINLGKRIMILPGVRYEWTENYYEGVAGSIRGNLGSSGTLMDTTGGQKYGELLPMVHVKVDISDGISLRLAATKTLSRPDYYNLIPSELINDAEQTVARGNPNIKHTTALNYDAFLSLYNSRIGYLTVGTFYKKLKDIDYITESRIFGGDYNGYRITEPVNGSESTVYGVEFDIQTDFRFLPKPLDGLILNTNFSIIHSETFFPYLKLVGNDPNPPFRPIYADTSRAGKLPGQPDFVASLSIGYEKGGFSGRVSYSYQREILERVGILAQEDIISDTYGYWDLSINQKFKKLDSITFFLNVNNFTNQSESSYTGLKAFTGEDEIFGMTADVGLRYRF
tara:strand:- start:22306 stop:25146 length:2841 start_codon:yes stop_codon:yes gene_type:complete